MDEATLMAEAVPGVLVCARCGSRVLPVRTTPRPVAVPGRSARVYPPLSSSTTFDYFCEECRGWTLPVEACPLRRNERADHA